MKSGNRRLILFLVLICAVLFPDMLVSVAQAQTKSFGEQLVDSLGIFIAPFAVLIIGGFTLILSLIHI